MTIKEKAAALGVSHQAIYKRLRNAGLSIADITTATGELTTDGEATIEQMYKGQRKQTGTGGGKPRQPAKGPTRAEFEELQAELLTYRQRLAESESRAAQLEAKAEDLTKERDYLRNALIREQEITMQQSQALTAASVKNLNLINAGQKRKGLIAAIKDKFTPKQQRGPATVTQAEVQPAEDQSADK